MYSHVHSYDSLLASASSPRCTPTCGARAKQSPPWLARLRLRPRRTPLAYLSRGCTCARLWAYDGATFRRPSRLGRGCMAEEHRLHGDLV